MIKSTEMSEARIMAYLKEIKSMLQINDLVNEKVAAEILGVSVKTIQNKVSAKKLEECYSYDVLGHRQYYVSKLRKLK